MWSRKALLFASVFGIVAMPAVASALPPVPDPPARAATPALDGEGGLGGADWGAFEAAPWRHDLDDSALLTEIDHGHRGYAYGPPPWNPYWVPPGHRKHRYKRRGHEGGEGGEGHYYGPVIIHQNHFHQAPRRRPAYTAPFPLPYRTVECPPVIRPGVISRATVGTIVGAAGGGLAGAQIGSGTGQLVATGVGTALGLLIGREIGASLDRQDQILAVAAEHQALAGPAGCRVQWHNPYSDHAGQVYVIDEGPYGRGGQYCREYQTTVTVGGRQQSAYGTACLQPDGSWQIAGG